MIDIVVKEATDNLLIGSMDKTIHLARVRQLAWIIQQLKKQYYESREINGAADDTNHSDR